MPEEGEARGIAGSQTIPANGGENSTPAMGQQRATGKERRGEERTAQIKKDSVPAWSFFAVAFFCSHPASSSLSLSPHQSVYLGLAENKNMRFLTASLVLHYGWDLCLSMSTVSATVHESVMIMVGVGTPTLVTHAATEGVKGSEEQSTHKKTQNTFFHALRSGTGVCSSKSRQTKEWEVKGEGEEQN